MDFEIYVPQAVLRFTRVSHARIHLPEAAKVMFDLMSLRLCLCQFLLQIAADSVLLLVTYSLFTNMFYLP